MYVVLGKRVCYLQPIKYVFPSTFERAKGQKKSLIKWGNAFKNKHMWRMETDWYSNQNRSLRQLLVRYGTVRTSQLKCSALNITSMSHATDWARNSPDTDESCLPSRDSIPWPPEQEAGNLPLSQQVLTYVVRACMQVSRSVIEIRCSNCDNRTIACSLHQNSGRK